MPVDVQKFLQLQAAVREREAAVHRAEGARAEQIKVLREQYGCNNLTEANALLAKWEAEAVAAETEYADAYNDFILEYGHVLGIGQEKGK